MYTVMFLYSGLGLKGIKGPISNSEAFFAPVEVSDEADSSFTNVCDNR